MISRFDQTGKTLLAEGRYVYFLDGILQPIEEWWQLRCVGDGMWLKSERHVPGLEIVLRVDAEITTGEILRCLLQWERAGTRVATAWFVRGAGGSRYYWRSRQQPTRRFEPIEPVFFPLLRVFTGAKIDAIQSGKPESAGRTEILIPWIEDPQQTHLLFSPSIATRSVSPVSCAAPLRPDGVPIPAPSPGLRCFQYVGEQYGEDTRCWVADGLLRAYRWNQNGRNWLVSLADFSGDWPEQLFAPRAAARQ